MTTRSSAAAGRSAPPSSPSRPRRDQRIWVVSGLQDLVVLKSTGSEFKGFLKDEYTTLQRDRRPDPGDVAGRAVAVRGHRRRLEQVLRRRSRPRLLETFATTYSRALQETLYPMGRGVLEATGEVAEIRFSAPNKHHFLVDLAPFGLENDGEVFIAADRPYGLIEAAVTRDDASDAGDAWSSVTSFMLSRSCR